MGWTSMHCGKGECRRIMQGLARPYEIVEDCLKRDRYFAAIKRPDGTVFALAVMLSWSPRSDYNLTFKDMDDSCGPNLYGCPLSILDKLTPTDKEYAIKWRKVNRELAELWAQVRPGALIELPASLRFEGGASGKLFYVESKRPFRLRMVKESWNGVGLTTSVQRYRLNPMDQLVGAKLRTDMPLI